ncbi:DUF6438 domain-containing protein [Flavobacterium suzhouense]|uniref:DUF6438 domain-containing protein n=1 Tax=Flavobacterium suzhouense TaxID=1529638 RepID=A0ABW5NWZ7_9FLAO
MVKNLFVLFLVVFFLSCEKKPVTPQEMILGNWSVVNKDSVMPWERDIRGFEFLADSTCDYKVGFWDWHKYQEERNRAIKNKQSLDDKILNYLGTKTKYKITKDSLKIFNLTEKIWELYQIKKFNKDTLIVKRDTIVSTFTKKKYDIGMSPDFDAVVFSSSLCYGSCPANDLVISKTGEVLYKGSYHVLNEGWYTAKIPLTEFEKIQRRFKEADYMGLKNDYYTMVTDSQQISVSFIKDGKIIKTISDYADSAPNEFIWAYTPLMYLGQKLDLKSKENKKYLDNDFFHSSFVTVDEQKGMNLTQSEVFYLVTLLMDAKNVDVRFDEKYLLRYDNNYIKEVKTDGRYYKLYLKNGKTEIKDIGFNYITDNKLSEKIEIIKR